MSVLPQDETGKAEHGYDYDFDAQKVAIYVDDGAGGIVLWDANLDLVGDIDISLDSLEVLVAAGNAILTTIDADTGALVIDLAAIEVLITAGNVDLAAMEVLLTSIQTAVEIMDDWDDGGDRANINTPDAVNIPGLTTTTPLNSGISWTGTGLSTLPYRSITIVCFADQDSAADGLQLQWSADGTNWTDHTAEYTYDANADLSIGASVRAGYFRIKYTNGGVNQSVFRLYTFMHPSQADTNIRPLSFAITDNESGPMVRSVLAAKRPNNSYGNIEATAGGNLKISMQEISDGLDIGAGNAGSETQRVSISTDDVNLVAIKNAVEIMDDWDETNRAKVNIIAGQAGVAAGAGAVGVTVPRVTLASNDPAVALLGTIDADTDAIKDGVDDQLIDYKFSGYLVSGTAVYLGYEDKAGAYYVQYIETSTGVVTYAVGTGGIVAIGSYSGLSYDTFATQF